MRREPEARARRRVPVALVLAAVAAAVYLDTLPGDFTFDDSFAVVSSGPTQPPDMMQRALGSDHPELLLMMATPSQLLPSCAACPAPRPCAPLALAPPTAAAPMQLYNGDVTDRSKPLRELFFNDFW